MSWGERSCTQFGSCKHGPTMSSCNVDCQFYVWNGKTKPDSEKTLQKQYQENPCPKAR